MKPKYINKFSDNIFDLLFILDSNGFGKLLALKIRLKL